MRLRCWLLISVALACSGAQPRGSPNWVVTPVTFGAVRFGMTLNEAKRALIDTSATSSEDRVGCTYYFSSILPAGTSLMIVDDTVVRIDVDTTGIVTSEGAQVGDAEAAVLALYRGRIRVEEHKYTGPEGHYLIVDAGADTLRRIVFETLDGRVTKYRAGLRPPVDYVEGCS